MPTTPVLQLPYPSPDDSVDVPRDVQALAEAIESHGAFILGEVRTFALAATPAHWLLCDGRVVEQADYPELFAAVGATWNTGGETASQFRLPPVAGRSIIGAGQGPGLTNRPVAARLGEEKHLLVVGEMPSHAHSTGEPAHSHSVGSSGGTLDHSHNSVFNTLQVAGSGGGAPVHSVDAWQAAVNHGSQGASVNLDHFHSLSAAVTGLVVNANGGGANHENMQPSLAMLVCIYAGR